MTVSVLRSQITWARGADILWIAALIVYVLAGTALAPFHGDESTLIMMSRDYYYQFIARDLEPVLYHEPPLNATEQHLRLLNGTTTKYLIGLSWHLGGFTVDDLNDQWDWGGDWDYNVAAGHMPSQPLLLNARAHAALLTALSVPLLFALAVLWQGRGAAYAASFLLATHPVVLLNGRRAIMEAVLLGFGLLAVLLAAWWGKRLTRGESMHKWHGWLLAVGLGTAVGLTASSKHTGLVIAAAGYGALLLVMLRPRKQTLRRTAGQLILSVVVALAVFLLLNPAWWSDPVRRAVDVLDLRQSLVDDQVAAFPETVYLDGFARLSGLLNHLSTAPVAYYEVGTWGDSLAESIADYEASPWTGIRYGTNALTMLLGLGLLALALIGVWPLGRSLRTGDGPALVIALWAGGLLLFTLLTIPLAWQRYYLPLYPAQALLAGAGLHWLFQHPRSPGLLRNRATHEPRS